MKHCINCLACFWSLMLLSLQPCRGQHDFIEFISKENGLPVEKIADIATDSKGYLWLGTAQGLYRFDGQEFRRFPLISGKDSIYLRNIVRIAIDRQDKIYCSFWNNGFGVFDPQTLELSHYVSEPGVEGALPSNTIYNVVDVDSLVYLQLESLGFVLFNKSEKTFRHFLPTQFIDAKKYPRANELLTCVKGHSNPFSLWITSPEGLLLFDVATKGHRYFPHDETPFKFFSARSAYLHSDGRLYIATWWEGILVFNTVPMRWEQQFSTDKNQRFNLSSASAFARGPKGEIWIHNEQGLLAFDPENHAFELRIPLRDKKAPYESGRFWSLGAQMKKIIPIGNGSFAMIDSSSDGMYLYHPNQQQLRKVQMESGIRCSAFTAGGLACLTADQPFFFVKQKADSQPEKIPIDLLEGDFGIRDCFADAQHTFWLVGEKSLYRYRWGDPRAQPVFFRGIDSLVQQGKWMIAGFMDSQQRVWIGTNRELLVLESLNRQDYRVGAFSDTLSGSKLGWRQFGDFLETDKNRVWFACDRGIGFSDDGGQSFFRYGMDSERSQPFEFVDFNALALDGKGRLWAGSAAGSGLIYLYPEQPHPQVLQVFKSDGPEELTTAVAALKSDEKGDIWGLSASGIFKINASGLTVSRFNRAYGLLPTQAYTLDRLPGHELMVGSANGYFKFQPEAMALDRRFPQPHIDAYRYVTSVDQEVVCPSPREIHLRHPDNSFEIDFSAPWFWAADRIAFQYRLAGYHSRWMDIGNERRIFLAKIPPGTHTLQLRASNAAGEWTDTNIVSLPVKIIPAFWQTWWFRLLALTALLGTGFWLYFYRQLQQSREQALKAEYEQQLSRLELSALRAQMNPHFIFNAFNSVKWYLIKGEREKTVDYLDKFSLLIRKVLESTRHEVVPLSEELETIRLMLEIEQMRFKNKFEYCIEVDENIDTQFLRVPPLILQPYVENAIWHGLLHKAGAPGRLTISLASIPGGVRCIIEDNGIGREKAKTLRSHSFRHTRSYGMQIGKERIALLSRQYFQAATLEVEDLTDETGQAAGTRVTVDLCP